MGGGEGDSGVFPVKWSSGMSRARRTSQGSEVGIAERFQNSRAGSFKARGEERQVFPPGRNRVSGSELHTEDRGGLPH